MRVLLTGGAGLIGRAIAAYLQARKWDVLIADIAPETDFPPEMYAVCDIMDFDRVRELVRGCDAVVHMAALRNPYYAPTQDVYRINTAGTFNVYEAAAAEGIKRVVQASSINAIGCAWNTTDFAPEYLPMDEAHPSYTTDSYSFSKWQIEEIGAFYWRRDGISGTALRFPGVFTAAVYDSGQYRENIAAMKRYFDDFLAKPEAEQRRLMSEVRRACLDYRASRPLEYPAKQIRPTPPDGFDPILWRSYTFDRFNLWAALHEEDAAQSVEKSLTADYQGAHPLFINSAYNTIDYESKTLARLFFPDVATWKEPVEGTGALVSNKRARDLIGFEPKYALRGA